MNHSRRSFTLLELIFTILILAIISSIAVSKYYDYFKTTNIIKIRGDILLIRLHIHEYRSDILLKNTTASYPSNLDTIINSLNIDYFIKKSDSIYDIKIDIDNTVEFKYEYLSGTFDCLHKTQEYCEDITR